MKVFNKGARTFQFHGLAIVPDKFTDLAPLVAKIGQEKLEAQIKKLLVDYPNELIAGENASADAKAAIGRASQLEKENATLKGQVDKLQKLLLASDDDKDSALTAAIARAEKAEARVAELEAAAAEPAKPHRTKKAAT